MYYIYQGALTKNGNGDINLIAEFKTKKEAIKCFNFSKKDNNGWYENAHTVETYLCSSNDKETAFDNIVQHYQLLLKK